MRYSGTDSPILSLHIDNKAYNMGIFGGTDIDFIQRYTYKAFDFNIKERLKRQT